MAVTIDGVGTVNGVTLPTTGFGKILQVVRATDTTLRTTTSGSIVDVTGMSVTITPQKSTSAVIVIATGGWSTTWTTGSTQYGTLYLTTSTNTALSGADGTLMGGLDISGVSTRLLLGGFTLIGYATPATTSPVTYKMRFLSNSASTTLSIRNDEADGQMYAIEVSA